MLWVFTEKTLLAHIPCNFLQVALPESVYTTLLQLWSTLSLKTTFANFTPLTLCWVSRVLFSPNPPSDIRLHLKCVHTALIHWNLHKLKQRWLFLWKGFGLHLALSLFYGDILNWHLRQWSIVTATRSSAMLTLFELTELPQLRRHRCFPPNKPPVWAVLLIQIHYKVVTQHCALDFLRTSVQSTCWIINTE